MASSEAEGSGTPLLDPDSCRDRICRDPTPGGKQANLILNVFEFRLGNRNPDHCRDRICRDPTPGDAQAVSGSTKSIPAVLRIRIEDNADPDPEFKVNADPDPIRDPKF